MTPTTKTLSDPNVLRARLERLQEPHIAPLTEYVQRLRARFPDRADSIAQFDPESGGVHARVLVLLEAPGPKAALTQQGASGIISPDNNDPTAAAILNAAHAANLPRTEFLCWNAVPWYVGTGQRIGAVSDAVLREARPFLPELVAHLPRLRVVLTLGQKAFLQWSGVKAAYLHTMHLASWHPSGQSTNMNPSRRKHVVRAFEMATKHLNFLEDAPSW